MTEKTDKVKKSTFDFYYAVPCPFCKCGKVMAWHIGHYKKPWVIECCECQAQGPHAETEDEAFRLWNKRRYGTIGE